MLLAVYGYCCRVSNGVDESSFERASQYVLKYSGHPLPALQAELEPIQAQRLVELVMTMRRMYDAGGDAIELQNHGAFDIETMINGEYASKQIYQDLLYHDRIRIWAVYVAIMCPGMEIEMA